MFVHIGEGYTLELKDIIFMLHCPVIMQSRGGSKAIEDFKKSPNYIDISRGKNKTLIITDKEIYMTRISPSTLICRSRQKLSALPIG